MRIVPATAELTHEFYGGRELPFSSRGYFLLNDEGRPIATAGFIRRSKDSRIIYTEGKDEIFRHKKEILKFAKMMLKIADENGWTLVSTAEENRETAHGFATHFGFVKQESGEYVR